MLIFRHKPILAALLLLSATAVWAATLENVRFGSHQGFDRMVCEFDAPIQYVLRDGTNGSIELHLKSVSVTDKFALPKLPSQIKLLNSVEAFRENASDIILEIRGAVPLSAVPLELAGPTWRLAIDLARRGEQLQTPTQPANDSTATAKPVTPKKSAKPKEPEYVPGDRPIETKLADGTTPPQTESQAVTPADPHVAQESAAHTEPEVNAHAEPEAQQLATADSIKALEVLADFYGITGDSQAAREYGALHKTRAGDTMDAAEQAVTEHSASSNAPLWMLIAIAFAAGITGGAIGARLRMPKLKLNLKLPKFALPKFTRKPKSPDAAAEIAKDLDTLDKAIAAEKREKPKREPKANPPVTAKPEPAPEPEPDFPDSEPAMEVAMKESLMDRRVKRVLELSAENRSLAEIAQELDMGQDEVKLILDLNS